MSLEKKLIYDIGAHEGEDSSWYLACGYDVIAVEANPVLAATLREKFNEEIKTRKLQVVQVALTAEKQKEVEFYVCEHSGEGSIFNKRMNEAGWKYTPVKVPALQLKDVFGIHGRGYYCKIDIEGADVPVLKTLEQSDLLPQYISVEICGKSLNELQGNPAELFIPLEHLVKLGYSKFKLIDQYTLASLSERPFYKWQRNYFFRFLKKGLKTLKIYPSYLLPRQWYQKKFNRIFSEDSSGPFGEMLQGNWYTSEMMREIIRDRFLEFDASDPIRMHIFWVDLHASF